MENWITDRLPELDEDGYSDRVLISYKLDDSEGVEIASYAPNNCMSTPLSGYDSPGWCSEVGEFTPEEVKGWMPLPKPYKSHDMEVEEATREFEKLLDEGFYEDSMRKPIHVATDETLKKIILEGCPKEGVVEFNIGMRRFKVVES